MTTMSIAIVMVIKIDQWWLIVMMRIDNHDYFDIVVHGSWFSDDHMMIVDDDYKDWLMKIVIYWLLAMPRVETQGHKKINKQSTDSFYSVMKLEKLGIDVYLQTDFNTIVGRKRLFRIETTRAIWSKPLFEPCVALEGLTSLIMTFIFSWFPAAIIWSKPLFRIALCQTFHGFTDFFHNVEKLGTDVYFTNSFNLSSTSLC